MYDGAYEMNEQELYDFIHEDEYEFTLLTPEECDEVAELCKKFYTEGVAK